MLLYFYHLRICFAQRQLVASNSHLNRIAEGSYFPYVDLHILRDSHIHDPALHRTLAMNLHYLDRLAAFRIS